MAISTFSLVCRRAKLEISQLNALASLRTRGICSVPRRRSSSLALGQGYTAARARYDGTSTNCPEQKQLTRFYSTQDENKARIISSTKEHSTGHNVATISISNPTKLNIVNSPLLDELIATCQQLSQDDQLRAVILTGSPTATGKAASFIGGADIREMSQMSSYDGARTFITRVHNACAALRDIPVPVIARVDGFCLGAGLEIAASCDMRIATRSSTFGMPEVKIGLPSVVEAAYLPGLIGWGRTRRFLYLAENIDGVTAEKWGLVEKLVDDTEALDQATDEWTDMIVGMGPKCIRAQKRLMQHWERSNVDEAIRAGIDSLAEAFEDGGKEPREAMEKFLNRRR
jgi:enoyl-CoA hydratase